MPYAKAILFIFSAVLACAEAGEAEEALQAAIAAWPIFKNTAIEFILLGKELKKMHSLIEKGKIIENEDVIKFKHISSYTICVTSKAVKPVWSSSSVHRIVPPSGTPMAAEDFRKVTNKTPDALVAEYIAEIIPGRELREVAAAGVEKIRVGMYVVGYGGQGTPFAYAVLYFKVF